MSEQQLEAPAMHGTKQKNRFIVFYKDTILSIRLGDISYFFIDEGAMHLVTTDGKKFPLRKSMKELEEVLDPQAFFRVNRSELIGFDAIDRIENYFGQRVVVFLQPFGKVIVSKSRLSAFLAWLDC